MFLRPQQIEPRYRLRGRPSGNGHLVLSPAELSWKAGVDVRVPACFSDGLWLSNAGHANLLARRLVAGLTPLEGTALLDPVGANEIFVVLPAAMHDALRDAGQYHPWPSDRPGERAYRLVTAFDTNPEDIDKFQAIAKQARVG